MAWYYGVNNSELYGSNFSTVLADAPPPLDDTFDEDDNEIVFRNDVGKSKRCNEKAITSPVKRRNLSNEFTDKSKLGDDVQNGENWRKLEQEATDNVEIEDDFGDFAGFADFGSAFGQCSTSGGEPQSWFTGEENSVKSFSAENAKEMQREQVCDIKDDDDEHGDFAAFQENVNSQGGQKSIPNDGSDPRSSGSNWVNKSEVENKNISSNGSYDMESNDDDFGDFTTVNDIIASHKENVSGNESKITLGQSDQAVGVTSQGKTSKGEYFESKGIISGSPRTAVQCNGDLADERSVHHSQELSANESSKEPRCSLGEVSLSDQNGEMETEGSSLKGFLSSGMSDNKKSDMVLRDEKRIRDYSICEHGTESERLPEEVESNDDSLGGFADFNDDVKDTAIDNNAMEKSVDRETDKSPVMPPKFAGVADGALQNETVPTEVVDDDNDFGDFGSYEEKNKKDKIESNSATPDLRTNSPCNEKEDGDGFGGFGAFQANDNDVRDISFGDFNATNSDDKQLPVEEQSVVNEFGDFASTNSNTMGDDGDKRDFGDFGDFKSNGKNSHKEDSDNEFGDFGGFETNAKNSGKGENDDDFGDFGSFRSNNKESDKGKHDRDFGEFGGFDSKGKEYIQKDDNDVDFGNFGGSDVQKDDNDSEFGDFGAFKANAVKSQKDNNADEFGDFGSFEAKNNFKGSEKSNDNTDDFGDFESKAKGGENDNDNFGDFGSFESNDKQSGLGQNFQSNSSGGFGAFKDSLEKSEDDDEFGDFGAFESKEKSVGRNHSHSQGPNASETKNKEDTTFGDFRTSLSPEFGALSCNSKSKDLNDKSGQTDENFGDFSGASDRKTSGFSSFSATISHSSVNAESSSKMHVDLEQQKTGILSHFHPGVSVMIKHAGDPVSVCFTSEQLRHASACQCDVLCTRVEKPLNHSNMGLWQQLERTEKEGRIIFSWTNSFSQHKKFLSLSICPERPPPLQAGSMLKPIVSSQFTSFGGGLTGSILMPEPSSNLPQFSSGLSFLEPVKTSQNKQTRDKQSSLHSGHTDVGLSDLSFILGNGLKRAASKSDVKDNVSDTTSESSSLDLDFFAPSVTQPSDGKTESRGLYKEDLLGLNILSPSVEPQKSESPKPQSKRSSADTKKVWQHGGVTIPLSSKQNKTELSATAKSILGQLEDLTFMNSSVLMFPLKSD